MKTVTWKGAPGFIPKYGSAAPNEDKDLPDDVADSYISAGLAVEKKVKSSKVGKHEEESE